MAYRDFTIEKIELLGYTIEEIEGVFKFQHASLSSYLNKEIKRIDKEIYDTTNEEGKKIFIISPVLKEVVEILDDQIALAPEKNFDVDKEKDLVGKPDFILGTLRLGQVAVPVVMIVEAKNEDLNSGFPQCMAEMIASQIFNQKKNVNKIIHGVVTTGFVWAFLKLEGTKFSIEKRKIKFVGKDNVSMIVGTIVQMIISTENLTLKQNTEETF